MLIVSLWQPWASLWCGSLQLKRHETRHWRFPDRYRGARCGVHAAKHRERFDDDDDLAELCARAFGSAWRKTLPYGAHIGEVTLLGCYPTEDRAREATEDDLLAGNWSDGRFAWEGDDPLTYATPIPMKGQQGFWNTDPKPQRGLFR